MKTRRPPMRYQLKISINDIRPPIWRRLVVPGELTLERLHELLQGAFGWTNSHLHHFVIAGKRYGTSSEDLDLQYDGEEITIKLCDIAAEGDTFEYEYDFGDSWLHKIVVEKTIEHSLNDLLSVCTGGARACPPEDCGGTGGYDDLLLAMKKRTRTKEEAHKVKWAGAFDPEEFDLVRINALLLGEQIGA